MKVWLLLVGCRYQIRGKENFKKGESYIVTCNHNSLLDVPLSSPFIEGPNKTIAKSSFAKVPLFGFFYMKGAVLVNRKDDRSRRESYEKMKNVLKAKMHMCIYPEGTRNRSNDPLKNFMMALSDWPWIRVIPSCRPLFLIQRKRYRPIKDSISGLLKSEFTSWNR